MVWIPQKNVSACIWRGAARLLPCGGYPLLFILQWANATGDEGAQVKNIMVFSRRAKRNVMARRRASLGQCSLDAPNGGVTGPLPMRVVEMFIGNTDGEGEEGGVSPLSDPWGVR